MKGVLLISILIVTACCHSLSHPDGLEYIRIKLNEEVIGLWSELSEPTEIEIHTVSATDSLYFEYTAGCTGPYSYGADIQRIEIKDSNNNLLSAVSVYSFTSSILRTGLSFLEDYQGDVNIFFNFHSRWGELLREEEIARITFKKEP